MSKSHPRAGNANRWADTSKKESDMKLFQDTFAINMKFLFPILLLLSACSPSVSAVETAIAQTQLAWTATPAPTFTPMPTSTPESVWGHCLLGKSMTTQFYDSLLEQRTCIYGVITDKKEFEDGGKLYNIYPSDKPITFLIVVRAGQVFEDLFPNALGILTTADVGDCIVVIGYPQRFEDGGPQFIGADVRDISQLTSELGSTNPIVQEITTLCK